MFRVLELITLDLLCLYFNDVTQYLEQTIRNAQTVGPIWPKQIYQLIQQGPSEVFDHLDSVLSDDVKLQTFVDTELWLVTKDT